MLSLGNLASHIRLNLKLLRIQLKATFPRLPWSKNPEKPEAGRGLQPRPERLRPQQFTKRE